MDLDKTIKDHFEEDKRNFKKIDDFMTTHSQDHEEFKASLKEIKCFMENLSGVSDFVKGAGLLKKPMMIFVALVVGVVALMGGLKTIIGWFIITK